MGKVYADGEMFEFEGGEFSVLSDTGVKVTRVRVLRGDSARTFTMQRDSSSPVLQLDVAYRGRKVEYFSPITSRNDRENMLQGQFVITTRIAGGSRAKRHTVVVRFNSLNPEWQVWLDGALEQLAPARY